MWTSQYTAYFLANIIVYLLAKAIYTLVGDKDKKKDEDEN